MSDIREQFKKKGLIIQEPFDMLIAEIERLSKEVKRLEETKAKKEIVFDFGSPKHRYL